VGGLDLLAAAPGPAATYRHRRRPRIGAVAADRSPAGSGQASRRAVTPSFATSYWFTDPRADHGSGRRWGLLWPPAVDLLDNVQGTWHRAAGTGHDRSRAW